jgi:hypothetical protein
VKLKVKEFGPILNGKYALQGYKRDTVQILMFVFGVYFCGSEADLLQIACFAQRLMKPVMGKSILSLSSFYSFLKKI